ncbi:hypothetical protein LLEC1_05843 [Akanthomyces lecanii]|uniref:Vacuolar ATPase assembly protein VMA22 n=1 Tax=Cordyceps confragosa TaxID=2714763 RepID=A0A179ICF5_CORDF|nr:hypothetical protein LLEC1_05843 [Akanthomyces lecanii]
MPREADQAIDELLERYLVLVDEYTTLRAALAAAQQRMFQALARANFTADRGVRRFGQDQYDERMQASRRVAISTAAAAAPSSSSAPLPVFTVAEEELVAEEAGHEEQGGDDGTGNKEEKKKEKKQAAAAGAARNPIRCTGQTASVSS